MITGNVINKEFVEHDDKIGDVIDIHGEQQNKVVLYDFDSTIIQCLYSGKDELGNKNLEYTENDLEYLFGKLTEMTLKNLNAVEKYFNVVKAYLFVKSKHRNYRKDISPVYKAHRPEPHPLLSKLYEYAEIAHNTVEAYKGYEADDMIAIVSKKIDNTGVIISIDKDMKLIPSIIYNPNKNIWCKITEKEAIFNFYSMLVTGDTADGIKGAKGVGEAWVKKNLSIDFTIEEYEKAVLQAYLKASKGNEELAKQELELNRKLITFAEEI